MIPQIYAYNMNSNRLLNRTLIKAITITVIYKATIPLIGSLQNSTKISLKNPQLKSEW